ncbi:DUF362 domain-containing protein [Desulfopila sp. IMCC35006]|uniref:DUF362 domain-containing protein n=1 Tax=Desulfopila sp. IMCC35006 TaxID=2569542 RepID=UPI0010ACCFB3|nr:DUF362 domain-containing protein [Desulfopila sp. IMCC35006]TKB23949.1 DUF362 domain-containing protein [Desulfopila sp. IMCC35006]
MLKQTTIVNTCEEYEISVVSQALPDNLFCQIRQGDSVIIKPNWVMESHKSRPDEWKCVITHPTVITAVLKKVVDHLCGKGRVTIIDGPMTEAKYDKIIAHYPVDQWRKLALDHRIELNIIDLREHEWAMKNDVVVKRRSLPGDPKGKVLVDLLDEKSEFWEHRKSQRGYYGADYDRGETNLAHDGSRNLYSVSRTVIDGDVFINMPKLKTHRTAGITCCLKNLVGINTYKNYLPHYSEGGPSEGGDQFPSDNINARIEGPLAAAIKQRVLKNSLFARYLTSLNTIGKKVFGDSKNVVRNGSWFGNDTLWRMVLDLNKILLYANPDGTMRPRPHVQAKRYIGVVDAILAGEGEGPLSPDPVTMGYLICGTNPVAIDTTCATLMGYDPLKIPTISRAFDVINYPLCDFSIGEIEIMMNGVRHGLNEIPAEFIIPFEPQHGWKDHIENSKFQQHTSTTLETL